MYNCINYILTCIKSLSLFFDKQPETETTTTIIEPELIINLPQVQHYYDYNIPTDKLIKSGFENRYIL